MKESIYLKKINIANFLSLKNVEIELGKLNVFIGPNASGKSNIIKAFKLLSNLANKGVPILEGYEKLDDIFFNFDMNNEISFKAEFKINESNLIYILKLSNKGYFEEARIENKLVFSGSITGIKNVLTKQGSYTQYHSPSSIMYQPHNDSIEEVYILSEFMKGISVYQFNPAKIRVSSPIANQNVIDEEGGNLARFILYLYLEKRELFRQIEDTMKSVIPEIEEIIPHLDGGSVMLWIKSKGLKNNLKPFNISDGTLRILAYITALYSGSKLVALEEPENSIHQHLLETIVDLARKSPTQVIMTTHSPYLLDHVKPEEIYVVNKKGNETEVKRLSSTEQIKAVKAFLEEGGTLGEAWYSKIF